MNAIEFKLIREELHLSQTELAELLEVSLRTLQRWEKGDFQIPDDKKQALAKMLVDVKTATDNFVGLLQEKGEKDMTIALLSYSPTCYDGDFPHYKLHNAVITKCKLQAEDLGYHVRLVKLHPDNYRNWLNGKEDNQANRANWASLQI